MTFSEIMKNTDGKILVHELNNSKDVNIQDVALFDPEDASYNLTTLYFCLDPMISTQTLPKHLILLSSKHNLDFFKDNADFSNHHIGVIDGKNFGKIFNHIKMLLDSQRKGLREELIALADETKSIETVLNKAAILLGNSLVFCDNRFKILACSTSIPVQDSLWENNIKQGYCDYDFIKEVKKLDSLKNASNTTEAIEVTCPASPHRKLSSKVFHKGLQIGFVMMIEGETMLQPLHRETLVTLSHVLTYMITKYQILTLDGKTLYQELLYHLLIGTPVQEIPAASELSSFRGTMVVMYLLPKTFRSQSHLQNYTAKALKRFFPEIHVTYHRNGIVAVLSLNNAYYISEKIMEKLSQFSKLEDINCGLSNVFTEIEQLKYFFNQALTALTLGKQHDSSKKVYLYNDYQLPQMFFDLQKTQALIDYQHPILFWLKDYDYTTNHDLYETLKTYIETGCSIKDTSEKLHVHRNSLSYRLEKITEKYHLDLTDQKLRLHLQLSFLLDELY